MAVSPFQPLRGMFNSPYAPAAPTAMATPQVGGVRGFFQNNQAGLGAIGAGLMSGKWGNYPGLPQAMAIDQARVAEKNKENKTLAWLQTQNMLSPEVVEYLKLHPEQVGAFAAEAWKRKMAGPEKPIAVGENERLWDPTTNSWLTEPADVRPKPKLSDESAMRKEFENKPGVNQYRIAVSRLGSMAKAVDDPSAMADMHFIYGMAQIFDPTSVVRQEEQRLVLTGQSLPAEIKAAWDKAVSGGQALGPEGRRALLKSSQYRVDQYRTQAEAETAFFRRNAAAAGMDPDVITQPLEPLPEWTPSLNPIPTPPSPDDPMGVGG